MKCPRAAILALVALVAAAGGCAGTITPEAVQAWVGRPAAALEQEWGAPTREVRDGETRVLIYEEVERQQARDFQSDEYRVYRRNYYEAKAIHPGPAVYVRSYLFWVDQAGRIVQADIRQP